MPLTLNDVEAVYFVYDGMEVLIPVGPKTFKTHGVTVFPNGAHIPGVVVTAAGYHARLVVKRFGVDRWTHIRHLLKRKDER